MKASLQYEFCAKVWQHAAPGGWVFVSVPLELAREMRSHLKWQEEGWGRLQVRACIGKTNWDTALWFDTQKQTYLLPIKASVRQNESIKNDQDLMVKLWI